jgi:large subunit ribosomal protein L25
MATMNLSIQSRTGTGKGAGRRLRALGRIPAVLYGAGMDAARPISIDAKELRSALHTPAGYRVILRLEIDGSAKAGQVALLKELQRHPVSHEYEHADLLAIDLKRPVEVHVPIHGQGTPIGVKLDAGILEWARRELHIRVLPTAIPESIDLDISELRLGQSLHVSDLKLTGFELLEDPSQTVCTVKSSRIVEAAPVAEAVPEAAATPATPAPAAG